MADSLSSAKCDHCWKHKLSASLSTCALAQYPKLCNTMLSVVFVIRQPHLHAAKSDLMILLACSAWEQWSEVQTHQKWGCASEPRHPYFYSTRFQHPFYCTHYDWSVYVTTCCYRRLVAPGWGRFPACHYIWGFRFTTIYSLYNL